jgi:Flp pilus assembly pilin Flp
VRNIRNKSKSGQTMVEYIIIVAIIAVAAIAIFGVFGDRLQGLVGGAAEELGADSGDVSGAKVESADFIKTLGTD